MHVSHEKAYSFGPLWKLHNSKPTPDFPTRVSSLKEDESFGEGFWIIPVFSSFSYLKCYLYAFNSTYTQVKIPCWID